jgi:hypothetical protein
MAATPGMAAIMKYVQPPGTWLMTSRITSRWSLELLAGRRREMQGGRCQEELLPQTRKRAVTSAVVMTTARIWAAS